MADNLLPHPDKQQLVAFGLGKLEPAEAVQIETHLEQCAACCATLLDLQDDTFVELLRRSPEPASRAAQIDALHAAQWNDAVMSAKTIDGPADDSRKSGDWPTALRDHPRYRLIKRIGRGGMGDVYQAEHRLMDRPVAIKLINQELVLNPQAVERFRREVRAAARLRHPNIVTAHDAEQAGDVHFLVMEFVDGTDLASVVQQRGPLSVSQACDCIRQAAMGLQHAHDMGMVHRDIKPHNLMLSDSGQVRILDFGLAAFAAESARMDAESGGQLNDQHVPPHLTAIGTLMGTPDYMSPEQTKDAHSADIRSDIYSLGCTFYYLLTGATPFQGDSVLEKVLAHVEREPTPLGDHRPDVPEELERVVGRMLAKNPDARYQTPGEVVEALQPFAGESPGAAGERELQELERMARGPADGIILTAVLHLLPWVIVMAMGGIEIVSGLAASLIMSLAMVALPLIPIMVWGGLRMRRLQSHVAARVAAILAVIPLTPASLLGVPMGIWALNVLHRPRIKTAFQGGTKQLRDVRRRASLPPSRPLLLSLACAGVLIAGIVIYLATDTGQIEIDARGLDDQNATIVLLKNGREYMKFDLKAGLETQSIRAGSYEVQLRGGNDVQMQVWTRPRGSNEWGEPDDHENESVVVYRGGGILVRVLQQASPQPESPSGILTDPPSVPPSGLDVGKNLIADGSLERTITGAIPRTWSTWLNDGPDFKCAVVEGGFTGQHCLQISGTGTRGVVFCTSIPLDRTKRFALKGRVKVEGEAGTWAVVKFNYFDNTGWLGVDDRVGVTTSEFDWKLFEKTDVADRYPRATLIVPTCHIEGNGTAWFDDLEVMAFDRETLPDDFDATHGKNNRSP